MISFARVESALAVARAELLAARESSGHWESDLPGSAFATAAAAVALAMVESASSRSGILDFQPQILSGLDWLAAHVNADGGWGDTPGSLSNPGTTTLCWAALGVLPEAEHKYANAVDRAERWLARFIAQAAPSAATDKSLAENVSAESDQVSASALTRALLAYYGKDRTLSVPILATCALTGRFGPDSEAWRFVLPLPFELAVLPRSWFSAIRLPVLRQALPALIAVGQSVHAHAPAWNPLVRWARNMTRRGTLKLLEEIQPTSGGFLEATPLTSFVVMNLSGIGQADHLVTKKGLAFLLRSQRPDGGWTIDSNLDTRVTSMAVNALAAPGSPLPVVELQEWFLDQQFDSIRIYAKEACSGWAWTDLAGGTPTADDTARVLLVLRRIQPLLPVPRSTRRHFALSAGIRWLLELQNSDGGVPTFCRARTQLAFDRSSPEVTAHAMRAWISCASEVPMFREKVDSALNRALTYLRKTQRADGSWASLWFGNQHTPENLTYGTSRVVLALVDLANSNSAMRQAVSDMLKQAVHWLASAQLADGSWSGYIGGASSVEETAWALEALAAAQEIENSENLHKILARGADWLAGKVESGLWKKPSVLGLHFARVWYEERLYPQILTVSAFNRILAACKKKSV